tara:strand:- start:578 stop:1753 length:1176 start_codon:yes stop_codon:yes gene_type:complete
MAQTITVNGTPMLVSDDISFPFWLESGSSISPEVPVSSISVLEFNIVPNNNGNDMVFNQVISVTEGQTVPEGKTWKVESILMDNQGFVNSDILSTNEIQNAEYIANAESGLHIKFYEPYYHSELSSVVFYADILPGGGGSPQHGGFCYSTTNSSPDLNDDCIFDQNVSIGSQFYNSVNVGFDLIPDTSYYVRAFVSNNSGVTFSNTYHFETYPYYIGMEYGGGFVYYIDSTNLHGFVISNESIGEYSFSCENNISTTSDFKMGQSNTEELILNQCNLSLFNTINEGFLGYDDWFIPSMGDLYYLRNLFGTGVFYNSVTNYYGIDVDHEIDGVDYSIKCPLDISSFNDLVNYSIQSSTTDGTDNDRFRFFNFSSGAQNTTSAEIDIRLIRQF